MSAEAAVEKFNEASRAIAQLEDENHEFFEQLVEMIDEYNAARAEAEKAVKTELRNDENRRRIRFGPFEAQRKQGATSYDGNVLADQVPGSIAEIFLTSEMRMIHEVDVDELLRLHRQGEISEEIMNAARVEKPAQIAMVTGGPKPLAFNIFRPKDE